MASLNLIVPVTIALSTVVQVELCIHLIFVPSKHSESKSSATAGSDCVTVVGRHTNWVYLNFYGWCKLYQSDWDESSFQYLHPMGYTESALCTVCWIVHAFYGMYAIVRVQMNCAIIPLSICSWFTRGIMLIRYWCLQTCPQNCWLQFAQGEKSYSYCFDNHCTMYISILQYITNYRLVKLCWPLWICFII